MASALLRPRSRRRTPGYSRLISSRACQSIRTRSRWATLPHTIARESVALDSIALRRRPRAP